MVWHFTQGGYAVSSIRTRNIGIPNVLAAIAAVEIIDDDHQRDAGQPGRIGLPFEPGQLVRHLRRRHQKFHDPVKAAAVDLPSLAMGALGQAGMRFSLTSLI
jgi:hypothetical protein